MSNDNIHYDYCRCCGIWVRDIQLRPNRVCENCMVEYGDGWPTHRKAIAAPISDEL